MFKKPRSGSPILRNLLFSVIVYTERFKMLLTELNGPVREIKSKIYETWRRL